MGQTRTLPLQEPMGTAPISRSRAPTAPARLSGILCRHTAAVNRPWPGRPGRLFRKLRRRRYSAVPALNLSLEAAGGDALW